MANIDRPKTPLDETLWRDQAWYRTWGPLTPFTVMDYFRLSTFFDNTSNNGTLFQQMQFRPEIRQELATPELFNARLRRMTGVEYMLATGSSDTGVWVIRKQLRRGVVRGEDGQEVEDVSVLATYYVVGENVFMAPAVGAVLMNRMLTAITALRSAQSIAAGIAEYRPAGSSAAAAAADKKDSTAASNNNNNTVGGSSAKDLPRALALHLKYQGEYMDDHAPLLGDPGSFLQSGPAAGGGVGGAAGAGGAGQGVVGGMGRGSRSGTPAVEKKEVGTPRRK
ncbi:MED6 mediator sub complex component-domain-containing protein [Morchella snyderi]|nr:MED6 mediator sub complex component-domain-containing protein [Morchella snyderi]